MVYTTDLIWYIANWADNTPWHFIWDITGYICFMRFNKVFLYTTIEQKTALSMYWKAGFILDCEGESQSKWGHLIQERKYVLDFMKQP